MRILCVSANPAIDRRIELDRLFPGQVNRARASRPLAGGKAAHVAIAAKSLGAEVRWLGFLGGATGEACAQGLVHFGIDVERVPIAGPTRENLELLESDGRITEVLEPGPMVAAAELALLEERFGRLLADASFVVLSGSLPPGVDPALYRRLVGASKVAGRPVLIDASGKACAEALSAHPDQVKPNLEEVEGLTGRKVDRLKAAVEAAQALIDLGARSVSLSMGPEGMLQVGPKPAGATLARAPRVDVRSTVGCGDAACAGFAVASLRGLSPEERLRFAVACGSANCHAPIPGLIDPKTVEELYRQVRTEVID